MSQTSYFDVWSVEFTDQLEAFAGATQSDIAIDTGITQSAFSRLESQADTQVSTLRRLVEALGGRLDTVATLPASPGR